MCARNWTHDQEDSVPLSYILSQSFFIFMTSSFFYSKFISAWNNLRYRISYEVSFIVTDFLSYVLSRYFFIFPSNLLYWFSVEYLFESLLIQRFTYVISLLSWHYYLDGKLILLILLGITCMGWIDTFSYTFKALFFFFFFPKFWF